MVPCRTSTCFKRPQTLPRKLIVKSSALREYPKGFGKSLVKIYGELKIAETPLACLRQKADTTRSSDSDYDLFTSLPLGDTWPDAALKDVYLYLWKYKKTIVPKEWASTLVLFTKELREVPGLHIRP